MIHCIGYLESTGSRKPVSEDCEKKNCTVRDKGEKKV